MISTYFTSILQHCHKVGQLPGGAFICCCCCRKKAATFRGSCCNILRISIAYFGACLKNALEKGRVTMLRLLYGSLNCCSITQLVLVALPSAAFFTLCLIGCCECRRSSAFIRFAYRRRRRIAFLSAQLLRQVAFVSYSQRGCLHCLPRQAPGFLFFCCVSSCQQKSRKSLIYFPGSQTNGLQARAASDA